MWRSAGIAALQAIDIDDRQIRIGACATHAKLAATLAELPQCAGLVSAAGNAANPSVRQMATVGGNLATGDFPASDLAPALLCLDAEVELQTAKGTQRLSIERFLDARRNLEPGTLLTSVIIPRKPARTAHVRLPLRKAGDYPVAVISISAVLGDTGAVEDIRVAVGSVEPAARRWSRLEQQLVGRPLDPDAAYGLAEADAAAFAGRDSVEAPGWYRRQVLPALMRRATQAVLSQR